MSIGTNYQNPLASPPTSLGHVCAVLMNGTIWCWGGNDVGQVGNGNNTTPVSAPELILAPISVGGGQVNY